MKNNKALLVIGGESPSSDIINKVLPDFSYVCAADSGLDTLRQWNIKPDLVIGDMDSIKDHGILSMYDNVKVFPEDKDYSDTEIAVLELRSMGYSYICLFGGGAGRLDHLLAIRALFERPKGPDEWLSPGGRLIRIDKPGNFSCPKGSMISVFPLSFGAYNMDSLGLKWPLKGLYFNAGYFGLSNVATDSSFYIDPGERPVLLVLPLDSRGPD